ncbi:MAG TPA: hypothetical protein VGP93_15615 [Polyangiaceae bacterium]|nr:hypothetical protein [Polyangiaceae bacterium]
MTRSRALFLLCIAALILASCRPARNAGQKVGHAAKATGTAVKNAGVKVGQAAKHAGQKLK